MSTPLQAGKVLIMSPQPFFQWRGSPIRVGFNAMALAELGFQVDLLVMPVGEDRAIPGVTLHRVPNVLGVKNLSIGPSAAKAFLDIFLFFKALRLHLKNRYDVIHGIEDAGPLAVWVAGFTGARMVFEKHSDPGSYKKGWLRNAVMWLYGQAERYAIRHADAVIGTGPGLVEQARKVAPGKPVYHIFDIPSSLVEADPIKTAEVRGQLLKAPGELLALYVGSFAVYQGIDLMFDSIPLVAQQHPHARFIIIGGTAQEIAERRAWLKGKGVESRVDFIGKIPPDELPNYLSAADILLSPRIAGTNTPLKLLDYLKAGRAIVATDNTANRLILDDTTAMLVAPTPDSFAAGIGRLIVDSCRRSSVAEKGLSLIHETFNYKEFKNRLYLCYNEIRNK
ncbi:MAG: glycosyltransferase family 4 protein [Lentisphaerota bacterium]